MAYKRGRLIGGGGGGGGLISGIKKMFQNEPGFESWTQRHMWVEFVVGSHPWSEGFSPGTLALGFHGNDHFRYCVVKGTEKPFPIDIFNLTEFLLF